MGEGYLAEPEPGEERFAVLSFFGGIGLQWASVCGTDGASVYCFGQQSSRQQARTLGKAFRLALAKLHLVLEVLLDFLL